jgi:glutathione S-transferase
MEAKMTDLILTTYDWVPPPPRGFVRDLRIRWALEEAGLPYRIESTPFRDRGPDHLAHQPFAQVPWLTDGDLSLFESGAVLLHLGQKSTALMPADPAGRAQVTQWVFAALNSVEPPVMAFIFLRFSGEGEDSTALAAMGRFVDLRLSRMEAVLSEREWLTGAFSVADILMSDVLRVLGPEGLGPKDKLDPYPACRAYVDRAMARPAFRKARADQIAHFAAAD